MFPRARVSEIEIIAFDNAVLDPLREELFVQLERDARLADARTPTDKQNLTFLHAFSIRLELPTTRGILT